MNYNITIENNILLIEVKYGGWMDGWMDDMSTDCPKY